MKKKLLIASFICFVIIPIVIGGIYLALFLFADDDLENFDGWTSFAPFELSVVRGNAISKNVMIEISIEYANPLAKKVGQHIHPRLRDAFFLEFYDYFHLLDTSSAISARVVRERILLAAGSIMGPDMVSAMRIEGAFERRRRDSDASRTPQQGRSQ